MGTFDCCSINVINVAVALILDSDKYTPQYASNVYIAAFIIHVLCPCQGY